jgi:hypothetical protein
MPGRDSENTLSIGVKRLLSKPQATNLMIDKTGARLWYGQQRASGRSAIARNAFASSILAAFGFRAS